MSVMLCFVTRWRQCWSLQFVYFDQGLLRTQLAGLAPKHSICYHVKCFHQHLEKSCGYKPIGCGNLSGSQHVVVGEVRCKVILVVPVWAKYIQRFVKDQRLPVIHMMVASVVVRLSGTMTTRVCHQSDLETSWGVSHCCEVKLRKYPVHPPRPEVAGSTLKRCPVSVQE